MVLSICRVVHIHVHDNEIFLDPNKKQLRKIINDLQTLDPNEKY